MRDALPVIESRIATRSIRHIAAASGFDVAEV
jgi:hypothetical protein